MGTVVDQSLLEGFYRTMTGSGGLGKVRAKSWTRFCETGLPDRKAGAFRYLPFNRLYAEAPSLPRTPVMDYDKVMGAVLPECATSFLVFIDGAFAPQLSNITALPELQILPLSEAERTYSTFLYNRAQRLFKHEHDPFSFLNGALHRDGAFLYVPPNTEVKAPIQILHMVSESGLFIASRLHAYFGGHSKAELVSTLVSKASVWVNGVCDFAVEEGAQVAFSSLTEAPNATLFNATRATLKRDSRLEGTWADSGAKSSRHDICIALLEENAEVHLHGALCPFGSRQAHAHVRVKHWAPHGRSSQLFKTLLSGDARTSFIGKILVDKEAQKTDAFQLNNNLLLGERAIAYSEPNLEILADDVKASHGSTTGKLDPEALFYLTSRGLATNGAKQLLIKGFIREIADRLPSSCQGLVEKWIQKLI